MSFAASYGLRLFRLLAEATRGRTRAIVGLLGLWLVGNPAVGATITVGPWTPLFKGVELAAGHQESGPEQQVRCLRVDLTDPDIALLTTPACTNCGGYDTLAEYTSGFLQANGVQVAVNGGFFRSSGGTVDSPLGTPELVFGQAISRGRQVSAYDASYRATMFFTSNNLAFYAPTNYPPTNTAGIYTAISGNHALLLNGRNLRAATPADLDPRTAIGLSQDRRYLYLLTIDGRQAGWSDGADFHDTGEWLRRFGASDGLNLDGGGSTTMAMADCVGGAVRLNRPSYFAEYGRERNIAQNFGVYARPLPSELKDLILEPGSTTAIFTWETDAPATTQVEYGTTTNYDRATPLEARLSRKHVATLTGLAPGSTYFFRAVSTAGGRSLTHACQFTTVVSAVTTEAFGLTQTWTYTTNNLDGVNWTALDYDDSGWLGQGPGLLYVEDASYVRPKNTMLPPAFGQRIPTTYYFRTHFSFAGNPAGASLTFSNYVDDGAVFHLNGAPIYRLRMPPEPTPIFQSTLATSYACIGTARAGDAAETCPDVFTVQGSSANHLVQGDNVLAVEVHNYSNGSLDVVFGSALAISTPVVVPPRLYFWVEDGVAICFWNGGGFTLEQSSDLSRPDAWVEVAGSPSTSPVSLAVAGAKYYRLRQ